MRRGSCAPVHLQQLALPQLELQAHPQLLNPRRSDVAGLQARLWVGVGRFIAFRVVRLQNILDLVQNLRMPETLDVEPFPWGMRWHATACG